eukprot:c19936_g1_i1 orf=3-257(+)
MHTAFFFLLSLKLDKHDFYLAYAEALHVKSGWRLVFFLVICSELAGTGLVCYFAWLMAHAYITRGVSYATLYPHGLQAMKAMNK